MFMTRTALFIAYYYLESIQIIKTFTLFYWYFRTILILVIILT